MNLNQENPFRPVLKSKMPEEKIIGKSEKTEVDELSLIKRALQIEKERADNLRKSFAQEGINISESELIEYLKLFNEEKINFWGYVGILKNKRNETKMSDLQIS